MRVSPILLVLSLLLFMSSCKKDFSKDYDYANACLYANTSQCNEDAFKLFSQLAEDGCLEAEYKVAMCYYIGIGTRQDKYEALDRFKKCAEKGEPLSMYMLGRCYKEGYGTEVNEELSLHYFNKASHLLTAIAEDNFESLKQHVAFCYVRNVEYVLSLCCSHNYEGANPDDEMKWLKRAANHGHRDAQQYMGISYSIGANGLKLDDQKAFEWRLKAAKQGHPEAIKSVAIAYLIGDGIEKNNDEFKKWSDLKVYTPIFDMMTE